MNSRELQRKLQFIRKVERGIRPDTEWVLRTREALCMQVANSLPVTPAPLSRRIQAAWRHLVPTQMLEYVRGPAFALLSIVGVVAGGSIASVSAAEQALPGDLLYPVKLAGEQTQLIFAKSKTDKLRIKTRFVERRVREMQAVATLPVSRKAERIQAAAENLRRDLDTVNDQLQEVSNNKNPDTIKEVLEAAKFVDEKSSAAVEALKDVKVGLSVEAQGKMMEVETAAVVTGIKAVQVLIESHDAPEGKEVISTDELSQSIQGKVQGIENQIASTAQKIITANGVSLTATSTATFLTASSTLLSLEVVTTSTVAPLMQIRSAQQSLQAAKDSLQQNKFDVVKDKLGEAVKAVAVAETVADVALKEAQKPVEVMATSTVSEPPVAMDAKALTSSTGALSPEAWSSSSTKMPTLKQAVPGG